jgi:N-acetylglutamate synthase-like GNAT family acetyltransferase
MHLRRANLADAPAITECVNAAYARWIPRIGQKPGPMLQDYSGVVRTSFVMVAEVNDNIVGVLVMIETDEGFLIDNVAVIPARQGDGIGRALLTHAEQKAKERGYSSLYLYTNELMSESIAMYARNGYVEYERRQEQGFRRVFLRKIIR